MRFEPDVCPTCAVRIEGTIHEPIFDTVRLLPPSGSPGRYVSHHLVTLQPCGHTYDGRITLR